ncbi:52 kDa repressor of the inhibitor of the protein kinase-like [Cydia amplana]|uniref:52 kDa repressor of the inhibitor of the protein kinase-like n=1 Tax=Cydia amplana TaxID=1869771 RepID=UPI002FE558A2
MDKRMINKGGKFLECPILTAAATPLAPRVECSVFGCRSSERDQVSFHPLPQDPDRCSQWLKLINRQDLADKLRSGQHAVVCSIHFLPEQIVNGVLVQNALPSLLLPTTKHQFVVDGMY